MPQHRNPILKLGNPSLRNHTKVPNELLRDGAAEMTSDGLTVLLFLMSHNNGWETSAVAITRQFGWGKNRDRAGNALQSIVKANRLVIREHQKPGGGRVRQEYIFKADGSKFTDVEMHQFSTPGFRE